MQAARRVGLLPFPVVARCGLKAKSDPPWTFDAGNAKDRL